MIAPPSIRINKTPAGVTTAGKSLSLTLLLTGFTQDIGIRVFNFDRGTSDRERTQYSVQVDLAKARQYGIQMQELPLLCRALLEQNGESMLPCTLVFTEERMCLHARLRTEARLAALLKRKPARRPVVTPAANGFRSLPQGSGFARTIAMSKVQEP